MRLVGPVRWSGWGILSPKGSFLEAHSACSFFGGRGELARYLAQLLKNRPKGSRLVRVRATLALVTKTLRTRNGTNLKDKNTI